MSVTVVGLIEFCLAQAQRMEADAPSMVVVGAELHRALCDELGSSDAGPRVAGLPVVPVQQVGPGSASDPADQMGDITGPDRVSVYVGQESTDTSYPLGHDPAMPVFFVPVPPLRLEDETEIGIYNHLRWYGLDIEGAFAGAAGHHQ